MTWGQTKRRPIMVAEKGPNMAMEKGPDMVAEKRPEMVAEKTQTRRSLRRYKVQSCETLMFKHCFTRRRLLIELLLERRPSYSNWW